MMNEKTAREWNSFAHYGCVFSVLFVLAGVGFAFVHWRHLRRAVPVEATITGYREREFRQGSGERVPVYAAVYEYRDPQGLLMRSVSMKARNPPSGKVGDKVRLLHTADRTEVAVEDDAFSRWRGLLIFGGLGVVISIPSVMVLRVTGRRLRELGPGVVVD